MGLENFGWDYFLWRHVIHEEIWILQDNLDDQEGERKVWMISGQFIMFTTHIQINNSLFLCLSLYINIITYLERLLCHCIQLYLTVFNCFIEGYSSNIPQYLTNLLEMWITFYICQAFLLNLKEAWVKNFSKFGGCSSKNF